MVNPWERITNFINAPVDSGRRDSLILLAGCLLAACGPAGEYNFEEVPGEPLSDEDIGKLKELGGFDRPEVPNTGLSPHAQGLLFAVPLTIETSRELAAGWRKVATPEFVRAAGIEVGEELSGVFHVRNTNGGFTICLPENRLWIKMIPESSPQALLLEHSVQAWTDNWTAAGIPDELIGKIQLLDSVKYNGVNYVAMVTPHPSPGITLESALLSGKIERDQAAQLLMDYYKRVLVRMNQGGTIQQDINFRNMVLVDGPEGRRLAGIDFDASVKMIDRRLIHEWQYQELSARALKRGIKLPPFTEIAHDLGAETSLTGKGMFGMDLKYGGQRVKVLVPQGVIGEASGDDKWNIIKQVNDGIVKKLGNFKQGEVMPLTIDLPNGTQTEVIIMKTAPVGERIVPYGGRLGQLLKAAKEATRVGGEVLFIWWALSELDALLTPPDSVQFISEVPIELNAISTGKITMQNSLDAIYNVVMAKKREMVYDGVIVNATNNALSQVGLARGDIARLAALRVDLNKVTDALLAEMEASIYPGLPMEVSFGSAVPTFPGDNHQTYVYFSACEDGGQRKIILNLVQYDDEIATVEPVGYFVSEKETDTWQYAPLVEDWTMSFKLMADKTFNCTMQASGDQIKFNCEIEE